MWSLKNIRENICGVIVDDGFHLNNVERGIFKNTADDMNLAM